MKDSFFHSPRDYALALVDDDYADADTLLLSCLKYMSHDDVRGMLDANELSPRFLATEILGDLGVDTVQYDTEAFITDITNGNTTMDDIAKYRHETIVSNSLINGQYKQAQEQCQSFGLSYDVILAQHRERQA